MLNEKIRVMMFTRGTGMKQISLNPKQFYRYSAALLVSVIVLLCLLINLFTGLFHSARITMLEKDRINLQKNLLLCKEKIAMLNDRMAGIEKTGDALRNAVGLTVIDQDVRQVGVGGPFSANTSDYNFYLDPVNQTSAEVDIDLNKIDREIQLEKTSLDEIAQTEQEQTRVAHAMPSIRPILGANVNPNFGLRLDPFTDKIMPHEGVDIPMPIGTAVLATADGVVETARTIYTPYKSYGMEVVVDHGFGRKTRYAHLSKILVSQGQNVKRWQKIGEVGSTGRSKGPHLHYEVLNSDRPENPMYYIFN
jgi:murein DD-endopeptidase MepM/ murein hydrolase activator NlpD